MLERYAFWVDSPEDHENSILDVPLIPALEKLASINQASFKELLSRSMSDFWKGKFVFYTLRPFQGDQVNEFDDVVTPAIDDGTNALGGDGAVGERAQKWVLTSRRLKFLWSREKVAAVLVDGLHELAPEYRPSEESFLALSRMEVSRYERINIYLPLFYMTRADLIAWCMREKLFLLKEWSVPEHEIRKAVSRASVRDALERQLAAHPQATKKEHLAALKQHITGLSVREFDRQWREITAKPAFAHFRDPGPRKKS